jgi:hypothetical protein
MTKGRRPTTGLDDAILTARARGEVMKFCPDLERVCDFMIRSTGHLVFVRVKRVSRLQCTQKEIEKECNETIQLLRSLPGSGPVIRELWIYTRHGWRYFRVGDTGIERIDKDGMPIPEQGDTPIATDGAPIAPEPKLTQTEG